MKKPKCLVCNKLVKSTYLVVATTKQCVHPLCYSNQFSGDRRMVGHKNAE